MVLGQNGDVTNSAPARPPKPPVPHIDIAPLAFLLGTWRGRGAGEYPTIDDFAYTEEVVFTHVGKPFLAYGQKTWDAETGQPLHAETGYLRAIGDGAVEFVIAQPSGIMETHVGRVSGPTLELTLHGVHRTPSSKSVTDVVRVFTFDGVNSLSYTLAMAAVGQPLLHHIAGTLQRVT